jgi:hypothetical protein
MYGLAEPFFAASAAGRLFLVMERQRGARRLKGGLGEPQEHLVGVSMTTAAAMLATALWRFL